MLFNLFLYVLYLFVVDVVLLSSMWVYNFFCFLKLVKILHGPFKSICRSGANPEKTLRIRGGAMQVYHHNQ